MCVYEKGKFKVAETLLSLVVDIDTFSITSSLIFMPCTFYKCLGISETTMDLSRAVYWENMVCCTSFGL